MSTAAILYTTAHINIHHVGNGNLHLYLMTSYNFAEKMEVEYRASQRVVLRAAVAVMIESPAPLWALPAH